ncbi:uncharacterized protein LOC110241525 [Exaiptasia diaphana]|uniref:WSC domain-containing protein n=1 Tax=Exaiptasia diaphana TaxID=2652724 RepID=A0A913XDL7_EXADI|nr:uncharacterized protein LOC110241525 [Exaiptasia diaphana]
MNKVFAIFLSFTIVATSYVIGSKQAQKYTAIGCFRDLGKSPRPLPTLLADLRNSIDWHNLNKTIDKCSQLADQRGFSVFGVQFYGECWSGKDAMTSYSKDGEAENCVVGVGQERANFVYKFLKKATQWKKANYKFIEGDIIGKTSFHSDLKTASVNCKQRCETIQGCKAVRLYDLDIGLVFCTLFKRVTKYTCPLDSTKLECVFAKGESWVKIS